MTATKDNNHNNIILLEDFYRRQEKHSNEGFIYRMLQEVDAEVSRRAKAEASQYADDIIKKELRELSEEVDALNVRLKYSFPISLVVFLCVFLTMSIVSVGLFVLQAMCGIKFIDFYILALCFVASMGLFVTSISTIIEFRKKLYEEK